MGHTANVIGYIQIRVSLSESSLAECFKKYMLYTTYWQKAEDDAQSNGREKDTDAYGDRQMHARTQDIYICMYMYMHSTYKYMCMM